MSEQRTMKRLFWRLWFANQRDFQEPGIYLTQSHTATLKRIHDDIEAVSEDDLEGVAKINALVAERNRLKFNHRIFPLWQSTPRAELVEFPEVTVIIAKDQPQYRPLPAHRVPGDPQGRIVFCWKLNFLARLRVLFTGELWHQVLTFNHPLQPQQLDAVKPDMAPAPVPQAEPVPASP
jgi:hypothetical protein